MQCFLQTTIVYVRGEENQCSGRNALEVRCNIVEKKEGRGVVQPAAGHVLETYPCII
jgi:hypothetical protein